MTIKDLKKRLNECEDNAEVIIEYNCSDEWYNYYGTIDEIDFDDKDIVLRIYNN